MTLQDYKLSLKRYYKNSLCPAEVGGPRRQKHARTPGLDIQPHETLGAVTRQLYREKWVGGNVEADGKMFTFGACTPVESAHSYGRIEQIDPITLDPIKSSPKSFFTARLIEDSGEAYWDEVLIVRYRSRRDVLTMVTSDAYQEIARDWTGIAQATVFLTTSAVNLVTPRLLILNLLLVIGLPIDYLLRSKAARLPQTL